VLEFGGAGRGEGSQVERLKCPPVTPFERHPNIGSSLRKKWTAPNNPAIVLAPTPHLPPVAGRGAVKPAGHMELRSSHEARGCLLDGDGTRSARRCRCLRCCGRGGPEPPPRSTGECDASHSHCYPCAHFQLDDHRAHDNYVFGEPLSIHRTGWDRPPLDKRCRKPIPPNCSQPLPPFNVLVERHSHRDAAWHGRHATDDEPKGLEHSAWWRSQCW
jgi:hypothetical protein